MTVNPPDPLSVEHLGRDAQILRNHQTRIRVRYHETDAQGRVHHATYPNYFELARVEMLRASGIRYRDLEQAGIQLVVTHLALRFHQGARFDDELTIESRITRARGVRIEHAYQILLESECIVEGETTVAAVNPEGKVVRLPDWLRPRELRDSPP